MLTTVEATEVQRQEVAARLEVDLILFTIEKALTEEQLLTTHTVDQTHQVLEIHHTPLLAEAQAQVEVHLTLLLVEAQVLLLIQEAAALHLEAQAQV